MAFSKDNYILIQGWMITGMKLKGNDLLLFALIYGFCQDKETQFKGTLKYMCGALNCSKPTVIKSLNSLQTLGVIIKVTQRRNNVSFCKYNVNFTKIENFTGSKESLQGGSKESLQGGSKESLPYNTIIDNTIIDNTKEKNYNKKITTSQFELFWKSYPKKVDKGKALTLWNKLCSKNAKDINRPEWKIIKKALHLQKKTERWQDPKYVPNPTTWLNQSRWLDEPSQMKVINFDKQPQKNSCTIGHLPKDKKDRIDYSLIPVEIVRG